MFNKVEKKEGGEGPLAELRPDCPEGNGAGGISNTLEGGVSQRQEGKKESGMCVPKINAEEGGRGSDLLATCPQKKKGKKGIYPSRFTVQKEKKTKFWACQRTVDLGKERRCRLIERRSTRTREERADSAVSALSAGGKKRGKDQRV